MISFALLTGIYAYSIFFLGIINVLTSFSLTVVTVFYVLILFFIFFTNRISYHISIPTVDRNSILLIGIIVLQIVVNFVGVLGPEYSFDAVWYHLVLPKLYLLHNGIYHIPGGLLYYSAMPKLGEMLFTAAISLHSEILAKGIQFLFGILIAILLYQFSRKYYATFLSLIIVLIFYGNIVVAWESTVAYIDLIRTFYEFFSLLFFIVWHKEQKDRYLFLSAIMLGLAITTKLLALGSLIILSSMMFFFVFQKRKEILPAVIKTTSFIFLALLVPLPWFIFSYIHTGSPVYPFFTSLYPTHSSWSLINPVTFLYDFFTIFIRAADPISPLFLIIIPFLFLFSSFRKEIKIVAMYSLGALLMWYITPRTGGGRFMLAYLPAFSLVIGEIIYLLGKQKKYALYHTVIVGVIIGIAVSTLVYRSLATSKYIPYLLGKESKQEFLIKHMNFSFGDFIDIDQKIEKSLKPDDVVLLVGFHNIYYVHFPFIDMSYVQKGDRFTHIATQHTTLPESYKDAIRVHEELRTGVTLYSVGEKRWKKY